MDMHAVSHVVGILLGCAIGWVFGWVYGESRARRRLLLNLRAIREQVAPWVVRRFGDGGLLPMSDATPIRYRFWFEYEDRGVLIQGDAYVSYEGDSGAAEEAFRRALEVALREPIAHGGLKITRLDGDL